MKKYLLGGIAFVMAIGLSAFTTRNNGDKKNPASFTDYYWFETNVGEGSQNAFKNSEVIYRNLVQPAAPTTICSAADTYKCMVGFSESQVINTGGSNYVVDDNNGNNFVTPANTISFRFRNSQ